MKNQNSNYAYDEIAKNEPRVKPGELLAEIEPLLKDYFEGEVTFDGNVITYILPNGQKFKLTAGDEKC